MMMSGKDFLRSHVLNWQQTVYSDSEDVTSCDKVHYHCADNKMYMCVCVFSVYKISLKHCSQWLDLLTVCWLSVGNWQLLTLTLLTALLLLLLALWKDIAMIRCCTVTMTLLPMSPGWLPWPLNQFTNETVLVWVFLHASLDAVD